MIFFRATQDLTVSITDHGEVINTLRFEAPPPEAVRAQNIPISHIYCTTTSELVQIEKAFKQQNAVVASVVDEDAIRRLPGFPVELGVSNRGEVEMIRRRQGASTSRGDIPPPPRAGVVKLEDQIQVLANRGRITIAFINSLGTSIGDTIIGMTALRILHTFLLQHFQQVDIDLFHRFKTRSCKAKLPLTGGSDSRIREDLPLPVTVEKLFQYDAFFDMGNFFDWEQTRTLPLVDWYLTKFGLDPAAVPDDAKRALVKVDEQALAPIRPHLDVLKSGGKLLLFHAEATSESRSIPPGKHAEIITTILEHTDYHVITARQIDFVHPRVTDVSRLSPTLDHFCALVSQVDAIVTADTATYHIADSFDIPTVVLFTTIPPELRVRYYPHTRGLALPGVDALQCYGQDNVHEPDQMAALLRLWDSLDIKQIVENLEDMTRRVEQGGQQLRCPICTNEAPRTVLDRWTRFALHGCPTCEGEFWAVPGAHDPGPAPARSRKLRPGTARQAAIDAVLTQPRYSLAAELLRILPHRGTHLDINCGIGALSAHCRDVGFQSHGIDSRRDAVEQGIEMLRHPELAVATLDDLPAHFPGRYLVITSLEGLEQHPSPDRFAHQVHARLEDGGYWFFTTPDRDTREPADRRSADHPPHVLTRWRRKTHRSFLERNGFEVVTHCTTHGFLVSIAQKKR